MAGGADVRRRSVRAAVAGAAVAGVLLGAAAFALQPLPVRSALGASTTVPASSSTTSSTAPGPTSTTAERTASPAVARTASPPPDVPSPRATPSRRATPAGPAFTSRALLQTSELLEHGWAKASELSLQEGFAEASLLRCVRPDRLTQEPVAAYAATYQGLRTQATEQVVRYANVADARDAIDRLTDQVRACGSAAAGLRARVGDRHEPDLEGISSTVWWNVRGAADGDPMRGVVTLVRVDDRLVVLYLHSTGTDPAVTTDILPLMRQAGLRLV